MTIYHIFALCGGLGLFLYGMHIMSEGLELAAGDKMQAILEKLTSNRFIGVLVGAGITALIQSSSATTVMLVGFVNTGLMKLSQAVWVIMGANIGTTITGQMIALDIGKLAPMIAFIGIIIIVFFKKKSVTCWGQIIAGLGILFIGMSMMSDSMMPLRDEPFFINLMTTFSNPLVGILVGAGFTAIIQSSSASVGILQALANAGLIGIYSSSFILFGQNIGTCITAFIASLGANRNAKRTTIIHLSFNIIGTAIFVAISLSLPLASWVESWTPNNVSAQIANMHTLFNIVTTLILLPFGYKLASLATKLLPIKDYELEEQQPVLHLNENNLGSTILAFANVKEELTRMYHLIQENVTLSFTMIKDNNINNFKKIEKNEKVIDFLTVEVSKFIGEISSKQLSDLDGQQCQAFFKITNDLERIGDHAYNLSQYILHAKERDIHLSDYERKEISKLEKLIQDSLLKIPDISKENPDILKQIRKNEKSVNTLQATFRESEVRRLVDKQCNASTCVSFTEMLIDIERIHDYIINISKACNEHNAIL